jgi:hypothetical protein
MITIQRTDAAGKGLSEKQPANPYIIQYANSLPFTVPVGAPGGPLKGSSMAGFPPTLIPPPGLLAERDAEARAEADFGAPGQFNLSGNPVHTDLPPPGEPVPGPGGELTLTALEPNTCELNGPDVTMVCVGNNFTESSVIYFAGQPEPIVFIDAQHISTVITASLPWGAVTVDVSVQEGSSQTTPLPFTFTEPAVALTAPEPGGPFSITRIEDDPDGLALIMPAGTGIKVGDSLLLEASGNSSVNGTYTVTAVKGTRIIIDNMFELPATIEAKGRVTVR